MEKFWEWMEKNGYAYLRGDVDWTLYDKKEKGTRPTGHTKQILFGYMLEYLLLLGITDKLNIHPAYDIDDHFSILEGAIELYGSEE